MRFNTIYLIIIILIAGCKSKENQEVMPETKSITEAIYASGTLVPFAEYKIVSGIDGYLNQIYIKEGVRVNKGDLLFTISNDWRTEQEQSAKSLLNKTIPAVNAQAPVMKDLRLKLELAKLKLATDSLNYVRNKNLYDQDIIAPTAFEKAKLQYEISKKELLSINEQLKQLRLQLDLQEQQAANQEAILRAQNNLGNIKSYRNGTIYEIYKKEGDLIQPGVPIALLGSGKMIAKLLIDEEDLYRVSEGQKVLITIDAFQNRTFKAHISKKYPILNRIDQSFRADAEFDDSLPEAVYGLNLEAHILLREKQSVLVIPAKALASDNSVRVKKGNGEESLLINTGSSDANFVEVTSGLSLQSKVIVKR